MTPEEAMEILKSFRGEIDGIDEGIMNLLVQRAAVASRIGDTKAAAGLPIVELSRERAVVERMVSRSQGALEPEAVERIYTAIMLEMRRIQEKRNLERNQNNNGGQQ